MVLDNPASADSNFSGSLGFEDWAVPRTSCISDEGPMRSFMPNANENHHAPQVAIEARNERALVWRGGVPTDRS